MKINRIGKDVTFNIEIKDNTEPISKEMISVELKYPSNKKEDRIFDFSDNFITFTYRMFIHYIVM